MPRELTSHNSHLPPLNIICAQLGLARGAAVTLLTQRRITVTWYVARRYRNRIWLTKLGGFLILTFALGLFASVVWQNATGLITCLSVGAAGGLAFNPERGMKLALLKAGDALVVKGHTLRFYNAVTG